MEPEKIMRKSVFGGFKREDVLSYVEELKNQIEQLKNDSEEKDKKIGELSDKVEQLNDECISLGSVKTELEERNNEIKTLKDENSGLNGRVEELSAVAEEYENAKQQIQDNNEAVKKAEARLGAAFIDARKYSDEIVSAANDRAYETSKSISDDISKQATEISRLSDEVDKISASFTESLNELHRNIAVLSQRMAAASKNLEMRHDAVFEPDFSIEIKKPEESKKAFSDNSGLTYIQYPPHTDFNEDLNIRPDGSFKTNEG